MSAPVAIGYGAVLYGLVFLPGAIAAAKGHGVWVLAGIVFTPIVWWYAAFRLALPGSWWEENRYGPDKRATSLERYGDARAKPWHSALAAALIAFPLTLALSLALVSG